jgi:prepilin-type N-terminal cleavage/methylation domain-containing protein
VAGDDLIKAAEGAAHDGPGGEEISELAAVCAEGGLDGSDVVDVEGDGHRDVFVDEGGEGACPAAVAGGGLGGGGEEAIGDPGHGRDDDGGVVVFGEGADEAGDVADAVGARHAGSTKFVQLQAHGALVVQGAGENSAIDGVDRLVVLPVVIASGMGRAFTLIEAMVTIAIAGIMATLAVGMGSEFVQRERARDDVETVRAHLIAARNHARRNAACVRVTRASDRTLTAAVVVDTALNCPDAPHAGAPPTPTTTLRVATSISPMLLNGAEVDSVLFRPDGSLPIAGPAVVKISTTNAPDTVLSLWPAAGIVKTGAPTP